ncbi:MAG TPA: hypothetical protein VGG32_01150 [Thermoplasmata archaeon]|jgi:hypothetical protein
MSTRRWARGVRVRSGALGGWRERAPPSDRRRALRAVARRDGAGEVSRRLNFVSNVASRSNNPNLRRVARADQRWVAANLEDEDRRRARGAKPVRVRGSSRARRHRRRRPRG